MQNHLSARGVLGVPGVYKVSRDTRHRSFDVTIPFRFQVSNSRLGPMALLDESATNRRDATLGNSSKLLLTCLPGDFFPVQTAF